MMMMMIIIITTVTTITVTTTVYMLAVDYHSCLLNTFLLSTKNIMSVVS
jgi:hypothetical protein